MFCYPERGPWVAAAVLVAAKEAVLWAQWRVVAWAPLQAADPTALLVHQSLLFLVSLIMALTLLYGQLHWCPCVLCVFVCVVRPHGHVVLICCCLCMSAQFVSACLDTVIAHMYVCCVL